MAKERYSFTPISSDKYQTTRYPKLERLRGDLYLMSRQGDRLDLLAEKFYGDVRQWWIIATANNIGKGSLTVPPGIQLRIPDPRVDYVTLMRNVNQNLGN
jgi:phage tail protein X